MLYIKSFLNQCFTFQGRLPRSGYWLGCLLLVALFIVTFILLMALDFVFSPHSMIGFIPKIAIFGFTLLVTLSGYFSFVIRRLHDRQKSGWWLLFYFLLPLLISFSPHFLIFNGAVNLPLLVVVAYIINTFISLFYFIDLGCLKGTDGPNRFGEDPLKDSEKKSWLSIAFPDEKLNP